MRDPSPQPRNRLALEKSPYLLQHAQNPVDWYPWGKEAFEKAAESNRPIFLSIGYSTCHWCHVMERETFMSEKCGEYLNAHFISIKVDREERPDVDKIYMTFVQSMSGGGGWPLNVFLTPELRPFYGGTYFPLETRQGQPGFLAVLERVVELWTTRRDEILASASEISSRLQELVTHESANAFPTGIRELHGAGQAMMAEFDPVDGGFGGAPKFPRPVQPQYLLRYAHRFHDAHAQRAVLMTCDKMASGGMCDQLGGGFSRYSVDNRWLVPHFEKMLYDNAQLASLYLDAYLVSGNARYAEVVRNVLSYVQRDMTHPEGGFYSAEDADSEGQEGRFYCWTLDELQKVLDPESLRLIVRYYGISQAGNFSDHSHPDPVRNLNVLSVVNPNVSETEQELLRAAKARLLEARAQRIRPHRDDKVLASWNGLMLAAVARAGAVLQDESLLHMARRNGEFLKKYLWDPKTETLSHRWRDGEKNSVQLLDAYANVGTGLLELYEATLEPEYLVFARQIVESMMRRFYDGDHGGFWQASEGTPDLILRVKEDYDGAEPSGNAVTALLLQRMAAICGCAEWREAAEKTLRLFAQRLHQLPQAVPGLLMALDFAQQEPKRVVVVGDPTWESTRKLVEAVHSVFEPNRVLLGNQGPVDTFARSLPGEENRAVAYCCSGQSCRPPVQDPEDVRIFLKTSNGEMPMTNG